jgi:hypothetical protein
MDIHLLWDVLFDVAQETQELLMPMSQLALGEDLAVGDVEGCEERRRTVANVVLRDAFDVAQSQRQQRLRALERLDLALFIDTQHQRIVRWMQIQAGHITHLLNENGSVESLKDFERCGCTPNNFR